MSSWLSKRTGIHINLRPLAPVAGGILGTLLLPGVGTALGASLGAGAGRAVDDLAHGSNIGDSLKHGAITGAETYGAGKVLGALGYGRGAAGQTSSTPAPDLTNAWQGEGLTPAVAPTAAVQAAGAQAAPRAGMSLADKLAIGGLALQGAGGIAGGVAQGQQLDFQKQQAMNRQNAINAGLGRLQGYSPQQFAPQSPFAPQAPQVAPPNAAAQWAAILRARGLPGLHPRYMGGG
jgi:hypothetical protein